MDVLIFLLLFIVVLVILVNWSVKDARLRGKSPMLVVIAVVAFFPLGWIVWLIFRPPPLSVDEPF